MSNPERPAMISAWGLGEIMRSERSLARCALIGTAFSCAVLLLGACSGEAETFGRSYDECVLRNATKSGDESSRSVATNICRRHFERAPTEAEQKTFSSEVAIKFDQPKLFDAGHFEDLMSATVWNADDGLLITKVVVEVDFYKTPPNAAGLWPGAESEVVSWDRIVAIDPGSSETIGGVWGDRERAPTRFYAGTVRVTKVVPLSHR